MHGIRRDIAGILLFKLVALAALYVLFFGPSHRLDATPEAVDQHVMGD